MREGRLKARLASRRNVTGALAILTFEPEVKLSFVPGQYTALGIRDHGKLVQRDYSIVSSPHEDLLEFFIKRADDDHLTARLFDLEPGDEVFINVPKGKLHLDRVGARPHHLMVATATGIAPFISMVRTLVIEEDRGMPPGMQVILLHGASRADEFGYEAELRNRASTRSWLTFVPTVSRPSENPAWREETGRAETLIEKTLDFLTWTPRDTTAYLCGHPAMVETGRKILEGRGFRKTQIREERY